jgi:spore germination cell wall hydrolase CwlJ-like protein
VAKVILNRVKDPEYPNTICGVVYQGSGRRNSCQFSFACDGLPDDVRSASAWANSKRIAQKALAGDAKVSAIGTATNYHADYVRPKWAKSMKRLIKIGRHVFYEDS